VIEELVRETLARVPVRRPLTISEILEVDGESRRVAGELVAARSGAVTV
jgi:hypothetical protein